MGVFFKFKGTTLKWVWKDLIHPNSKSFILIFLLDILSVLGQVAAYGLLLKYVNALEQTSELTFLGNSYVPQSSQTLLIAVATGTGALFLFYGLMDYLSQIKVIQMTKKYESFCSQRVITSLSAINRKLDFQKGERPDFDNRRLKKALIKDARYSARLVKFFQFSTVTLVKFFGSLIFMFSVNFSLTLIILLMIIPIFFALRHMARQVARLTQKRETKLPGFIYSQKQLMQAAFTPSLEAPSDTHEFDPAKEVSDFYNMYHDISRKLAKSDFIILAFIAVLAILIVLTAGNLVMFGDMSWTIFIAYIVALRYFFGSLKGLNGVFKKSSKIYDYLNHYINTLQQIETGKGVPVLAAYKKAEISSVKKSNGLGLDLDDDDDDDDDDL